MKRYNLLWLAAFIVMGGFFGCAGKQETIRVERQAGIRPDTIMRVVGRWGMPDFSDDMMDDGLRTAVEQSLAYYRRVGGEKVFWFGEDALKGKDAQQALEQFLTLLATTSPGKERKKAIRTAFRVYRAGGKKTEVLYTGYYEPVLHGSRSKSTKYQVPLYSVPGDLIVVDLGLFRSDLRGVRIVGRYEQGKFVPYYTRHEIDRLGLLEGRGLEIAWVTDPIEAFFLHVQGSGKIMLPDGDSLAVHYATSNGKPYRSIGRLLLDTGKIPKDKASLSGLTEYLRDNPECRDSILDYNESYVFFEEVPQGPLGSLNVLLTPGRSLATDQQVYPPGALVYIETEMPVLSSDGNIAGWRSVKRFMLNQDTGGAIRGPNRADVYWGSGDEAGKQAGSMQKEGKLYFFAPSTK